METIIFAHTVRDRERGIIKPELVCFALNEESLRRFKSESLKDFEYPDCEVYCNEDTYMWIKKRAVNNVFVPTEEEIQEMREDHHFYKEIVLL
jgi:hypothetical protein